jgi:glucose/arabinose dehydrogenase
MTFSANLSRPAFFAAAAVAALMAAPGLKAQELKHYESNNKDFWMHPPPDWYLGDETEQQKGLNVPPGRPTPMPAAELEANLKKIKLPQGFKISVYASGVHQAREMAMGDKGTLFVGSFQVGNVYAITDQGGQKTVKTILKDLKMPTGIAYRDSALYVAAIDRILRYDNAESSLDKMPDPKVVYDDMPPYVPHGWKYLAFDKKGMLYVPFGPPCNECMPPTTVSQVRRVDPSNGTAEIIALGVRNSVGGDVDPRTGDYWFSENARDWLGDDVPSDKLNHVTRVAEHFGYPYCHQGDIPDPKFALGHKCSEFAPPALKLGAHVAPLGMKFYTGNQFPAAYRDNIFLAEHGSWNRHKRQGARIMRIIVDKDGRNIKQEVFAEGWLQPDNNYWGRPTDVLVAPDGSLLVADDEAGAIYRISYAK